jgi:hypothetical protein
MWKRVTLGLMLATAIACGGDSTSPEHPFPAANGAYALDGGFDGLTRSEASFTGTAHVNQASQDTGTLTGTATLTLTLDGDVSTVSDVQLLEASVSPSGVVSFRLGASTSTWTFSGTLLNDKITVRHTLTDGSFTASGDWTGTRPD